jgi:Zn-dependent M16 (insulinase) family peptidase
MFRFQGDFSIEAMKVIMTYLTDSPVATLQQILVECPDPYCSDVGFDFIENSEGCLYITAENVPTEKLDEVVPR